MRFAIALAVAIILAACALQQTGSERSFLGGHSRATQAALDADAIMQGMAQARQSSDRVARDNARNGARSASPGITR